MLFIYKIAKEWKYALSDRFTHHKVVHESCWKMSEVQNVEVNMKSTGQHSV